MTKEVSFCLSLLVIAVVGCDRPDPTTISVCKAAQKWLGSTADDYKRCLRDSEYRKDLDTKTALRFSDAIASGHNDHRATLEPRGYDLSTFAQIENMSQVPVSILGLDEQAKAHKGKRYVIAATVSVLPRSEAGESLAIFVHGAKSGSNEQDPNMVGPDALNEYQKRFLLDYCSFTEGTSLCEGQVYFEIREDAKGLFIAPEMVGALFKEAEAQRVFDHLQETKRQAESARAVGKGRWAR